MPRLSYTHCSDKERIDRQGTRYRESFRSAFTALQRRARPPYERHEPGNATVAYYMAGMGVPQQVIEIQVAGDDSVHAGAPASAFS